MEEHLRHSDCRNFCSVDVVKGICRRTSEMVQIDSDVCESYLQLPKCKFCNSYLRTGEGLGICRAEQDEPWAYAEMIAVTCKEYSPLAP
jgi:4-hydroxyphenylacetate decarboxylase small subunit